MEKLISESKLVEADKKKIEK